MQCTEYTLFFEVPVCMKYTESRAEPNVMIRIITNNQYPYPLGAADDQLIPCKLLIEEYLYRMSSRNRGKSVENISASF